MYENVTTASKGLQIFTFTRHSMPLTIEGIFFFHATSTVTRDIHIHGYIRGSETFTSVNVWQRSFMSLLLEHLSRTCEKNALQSEPLQQYASILEQNEFVSHSYRNADCSCDNALYQHMKLSVS